MKKIVDTKEIESCFRERRATLSALIDRDPRLAIEAARALTPDDVLNARNISALSAGILIDAGIAGNDIQAVDEGVDSLQLLLNKDPGRGDIQYCLANGLVGKAD